MPRFDSGLRHCVLPLLATAVCVAALSEPLAAMNGPEAYEIYCVSCHSAGIPPEPDIMRLMTAEQIFNALDLTRYFVWRPAMRVRPYECLERYGTE